VRLALFQSAAEPCGPRISPNDVHPALAWVRCHLLATHDRTIRSAPGRVFLECQHCGARSRGWDLGPARYHASPQPGTTAIASISADPIPAAAGVASVPPAQARARAARLAPGWPRRTGRVLHELRRLAAAPARAPQATELDARAPGAAARARMHASRDPPPVRRRSTARAGPAPCSHRFFHAARARSWQFPPSASTGAKVHASVSNCNIA
jgi:hypothetical protein